MYELVVAASFTVALKDVSSGPDIQLFSKFKKSWSQLNACEYECGMNIPRSTEIVPQHLKDEIIHFANDQLLHILNEERHDYREVLVLVLTFLGKKTISNVPIRIKKPGALHRARWMAKIIYSLKIFLFRKQFKLSGMSFL